MVTSRVILLLEKMLSSDGGEEEVAAGWERFMGGWGECQFEKLVLSQKALLRKQGLALLSCCVWYLNLCGLAKYI